MVTKKKKNDELQEITEKITIIDKIAKMLSKYGYKKVISSVLIFMLLAATIIVFSNQKMIIERIIKEHQQEIQIDEANKLKFRINQVNPRVDASLYRLLAQTKGDRVFIIEMHNGTDNPSGLPFVFGDMTYEKLGNDSVESILYEYDRINLSAFPIATYLIKHKRFVGTIEDLKKIDIRLGKKMEINGAKYVALYGIRGIDVEIGWLGVTYCNSTPSEKDKDNIESSLLDCSQGLSILLDMTKNIK